MERVTGAVGRRPMRTAGCNFYIRSLRLNVDDRGFGERMTEVFEADLAQARPYGYATWQQRPLREKLAEKLLRPIKSQL